jgi:hypothetical protein
MGAYSRRRFAWPANFDRVNTRRHLGCHDGQKDCAGSTLPGHAEQSAKVIIIESR